MKRVVTILPLLVTLMLLGGCIANGRHLGLVQNPPPNLGLFAEPLSAGKKYPAITPDIFEQYRSFLEREAFVIEFDDEGELWPADTLPVRRAKVGVEDPPRSLPADPILGRPMSQFEQARSAIRFAKQAGKDVTLIVFAHGWKHGAMRETSNHAPSNLVSFERFMKALRQTEYAKNMHDRVFIGVYLAWRGALWDPLRESFKYDPIRNLSDIGLSFTLWNRLNAADRVGRASGTSVMLTLAAEAKRRDLNPRETKDFVIFVGHSMGARVVEHAVGQALTGALIFGTPQTEFIRRLQEEHGPKAQQQINKANLELRHLEPLLDETEPKRVAALQKVDTAEEQVARDRAALDEFLQRRRTATRLPSLARSPNTPQEDLVFAQRALSATLEEANRKIKQLADASPAQGGQAAADLTSQVGVLVAQTQKVEEAKQEASLQEAKHAELESHLKAAESAARAARTELREVLSEAKNLSALITVQNEQRQTAQRELDGFSDAINMTTSRLADLVLLVNPATDSILSRQLREALADKWLQKTMENNGIFPGPWIVSISSNADAATRFWYKVGAAPHIVLRSYRDWNQYNDFGTPGPHNDRFRNFEMRAVTAKEVIQDNRKQIAAREKETAKTHPGYQLDEEKSGTMSELIDMNIDKGNSAAGLKGPIWTRRMHGAGICAREAAYINSYQQMPRLPITVSWADPIGRFAPRTTCCQGTMTSFRMISMRSRPRSFG